MRAEGFHNAGKSEARMPYKTIMVHLELSGDNAGVLSVAAELSKRFGAAVIGIALAQPMQVLYEEGWTAIDVVTADRTETEKELAACEAQFRRALQDCTSDIEWQGEMTYEPLADVIAERARAADLIVTGRDIGGALFDTSRRVNIGQLAMTAGRPVLLVPQGITSLPLRNVFIGWKDAREARRAVSDALPLLAAADQVTVLTVTDLVETRQSDLEIEDVVSWLGRHGTKAKGVTVTFEGSETACLNRELKNRGCDLLVAGAFGHNRLGEWVFGGATQDLLLDPDFCVLLSH